MSTYKVKFIKTSEIEIEAKNEKEAYFNAEKLDDYYIEAKASCWDIDFTSLIE